MDGVPKSLSICSDKPKAIEFSIGDNKLKSVQDAPEKFLGVLITLYNKTSDHFEVVKSKLNSMIENINVSLIRNEFKLRVYNEYSVPSIRYLLMTHELTDTQLNSLDQIHTNAVKSWLQMKPKGPAPAILFSPDPLNLRHISDIYVESHTVLYGRTMTLADNRTKNALESKLERQSLWTTKMTRNGIQVWDSVYNEAITTSPVSVSKWSKIKKTIQDILTQKRSDYWIDNIRPLIQQGKMLEFIYLEQSDLTWRSIIYDLPRGVLSFAVRSSIDFLPTLSNLKCWGKGPMLAVLSLRTMKLCAMSLTIVLSV